MSDVCWVSAGLTDLGTADEPLGPRAKTSEKVGGVKGGKIFEYSKAVGRILDGPRRLRDQRAKWVRTG